MRIHQKPSLKFSLKKPSLKKPHKDETRHEISEIVQN